MQKLKTTSCQCEQCRKQTGALVMYAHTVPIESVTYTTSTSDLAIYRASAAAQRGFCRACGSTLFWQPEGRTTSILVGTMDKDDLKRWGRLLVGSGRHLWVEDAVEGVTDQLEGEKWKFDCLGEGAQRME